MPCLHNFGIVKNIDKNHIYNKFQLDVAENVIPVEDDVVSAWYFESMNMVCYSDEISKLSKGFNMVGVTIIPPSSLYRFIEIVEKKTPKDKQYEIMELIDLISLAIRTDKYMIHFGV